MIPGALEIDAADYRSIFTQSCVPTMVMATSRHGLVVVEANPAAIRMLGREHDSLVGRIGTDAVSPHDRERIVEAARALSAGELQVWRDEVELTGLVPRWVNLTMTPLSSTGSRALLLVQLVDCTAERTAYSLVESVLDATTGTAIIGTDPDGDVVFFNTGAERMLGYRADEVVGTVAPERFHDPDELAERAARLGMPGGYGAVVAPVSHGAGTDRREWTYVRADGRRLRVSVSVSPMRGPSGAEAGFLAVAEDVSEYHRAEAMLQEALVREREAVERLHALDRAKTDFVSSVSHELRTPLTSVLGFTEVLQSGVAGDLTEPQASMLTRVEQNGRRLLVLIEDLLTLSTIEAGTFRLERHEIDLGDLVHRSLHPVDSLLRGRDLDLHISLPPEPVRVSGDPDQLARVVTNLVTNAVKFTPDGGRISVHVECDDQGGVLRVTDTGMGVPPAEQGQLFTRFFRASGAYDRAIPGTGLGLSIVKSIVEEHDGSVSLRSHPGEGAEFTVRLPVA